jgi:hypothetical protein
MQLTLQQETRVAKHPLLISIPIWIDIWFSVWLFVCWMFCLLGCTCRYYYYCTSTTVVGWKKWDRDEGRQAGDAVGRILYGRWRKWCWCYY